MYSQITLARIQQTRQLSGQYQDRRQIQIPFIGLDASSHEVSYTDRLTFYHGKLESSETLGTGLELDNE